MEAAMKLRLIGWNRKFSVSHWLYIECFNHVFNVVLLFFCGMILDTKSRKPNSIDYSMIFNTSFTIANGFPFLFIFELFDPVVFFSLFTCNFICIFFDQVMFWKLYTDLWELKLKQKQKQKYFSFELLGNVCPIIRIIIQKLACIFEWWKWLLYFAWCCCVSACDFVE